MKFGWGTIALAIILGIIIALIGRDVIEGRSKENPQISITRELELEDSLRSITKQKHYLATVAVRVSAGNNEMDDLLLTGFMVGNGYILTADHSLVSEAISIRVTFEDGKSYAARYSGNAEIQKHDLALIVINPVFVSTPLVFASLSRSIKSNVFYEGNEPDAEERMVVIRCTNADWSMRLDRILIGEIRLWKNHLQEVDVRQRKGGWHGCSGAPALNLRGEIVGMVSSGGEQIISLIDAEALREAIPLLISRYESTK